MYDTPRNNPEWGTIFRTYQLSLIVLVVVKSSVHILFPPFEAVIPGYKKYYLFSLLCILHPSFATYRELIKYTTCVNMCSMCSQYITLLQPKDMSYSNEVCVIVTKLIPVVLSLTIYPLFLRQSWIDLYPFPYIKACLPYLQDLSFILGFVS